MRRRQVIALGGVGVLGGSGAIAGTTLYGSTSLEIDSTDDGAVIRADGEEVDTLANPAVTAESDDALVGIAVPERTTVQQVAVEVVWAIQQDGLWSDAVVELVPDGEHGVTLDPGGASAYGSTWGRSPTPASTSSAERRRYTYPRGTTAGRADTALTVHPGDDVEDETVELDATLSARSLGGTEIDLIASTEVTYAPE